MTEIKIESCVLAEVEGDKVNALWCPFFRQGGADREPWCIYHKDERGYYGRDIPFEVINGRADDKPDWCQVNKITVHTNV